jgi:hypothetical protein
MPILLTVKPKERSTLVLVVSWYDEDDQAVTPTAGTWTLTDTAGAVVDEKEDQAFLEALATENTIVLTDASLAVLATAPDDRRIVTVQATYNSSQGSGLKLNEECIFSLTDLVAVT